MKRKHDVAVRIHCEHLTNAKLLRATRIVEVNGKRVYECTRCYELVTQ